MMKWYFKILAGHTPVRVFMNGAKCGDLCFRNEEFEIIREGLGTRIIFVDEDQEQMKNDEDC
jgi:hypothetical protein